MMGNGRGFGFDYGNMMGGGWSGGWPILLLGALVVAAIVLLVVWGVRASRRR
jgi:hypothetical protein